MKVKDSIAINITENPQFIENALKKKLKPVYETVDKMSKDFGEVQKGVTKSLTSMESGITGLKSDLVGQVQQVVDKIPANISENLENLAIERTKSTTKGDLGEGIVLSILQENLREYTIEDVSSQAGKGDIHITSTQSRQKYLVEVKNRTSEVPAKEIEKFEKNVRGNKDFKAGILFSLRSGIDVRARHGRFKIKFQDGQYYIYVPNALKEREDLIVWIVILADQLAVLNQGLTDKQTDEVQNLLNEFQKKHGHNQVV